MAGQKNEWDEEEGEERALVARDQGLRVILPP